MDFGPMEAFVFGSGSEGCADADFVQRQLAKRCESELPAIARRRRGRRRFLRMWHAALGEVFGAAAASAELGHGFFQQRAHVVGLPGGLSEDQRGLRRIGGEQRDRGGLPR